MVVLLADGDNNWVTRYDPARATDLAKAANVKIYAFMIGNENDAFGGMATNPVELRKMADATNGLFFSAPDVAAIDRGLQTIRTTLDH